MRVYHGVGEAGSETKPSAVTIGNFDGVHVAHRELLRRVVEEARADRAKPTVLTFDPHPMKIISPHRAPRLLTRLESRYELLEQQGIEQVLVIPFNLEFSRLTAQQFVDEILVRVLGAISIVVGENFRFGNRAAGDADLLRSLGPSRGFRTVVVPGMTLRGRMVSSTAVRDLIDAGDVGIAARLLARPFALEGKIVQGEGIGSKRTVPTLNLRTDSEILPRTGVYITRTHDLDSPRVWKSITNIGFRPTFEGSGLTVETFLLDPLTGEAPQHIRLEFCRRVREERKFSSAEALKTQIFKDVVRAQAWFRRVERMSRAVH